MNALFETTTKASFEDVFSFPVVFQDLNHTTGVLLVCAAMMMMAVSVVVLFLAGWNNTTVQKEEIFTRFIRQQRKHLDDLNEVLPFRSEFYDDFDFATVDIRNPAIPVNVTHFCFLVHGFRGTSRDLGYVQSAMKNAGEQLVESNPCRFIVHSASCNEKKTDDGVASGGERLMDEMILTIRERMRGSEQGLNRLGLKDVTISLLGNSLGGLYARYALSTLRRRCKASCRKRENKNQNDTLVLDDMYQLHLNHFCTTATPHLGVAGHTFLPLPRRAEIGVAHAMGQSGKDLFRVNALLHTMATHHRFVEPLACFKKRTAYANAYGTDFPVPAATAAFLHANSSYPHHVVETSISSLLNSESSDGLESSPDAVEKRLVIATMETPASADRSSHHAKRPEGLDDQLASMSISLDSLGWKKVFVDMRKEVPRIVVPKSLVKMRRSSNSDSDDTASESSSTHSERSEGGDAKTTVSSKDVAAAVTALPDVVGLYWPLGHNMMVAFSRSRWSTYMNKAGRPVVDGLAKELVDDIFAWDGSEAK